MGISWSSSSNSNRRRNNHYPQHPPSQFISSSSASSYPYPSDPYPSPPLPPPPLFAFPPPPPPPVYSSSSYYFSGAYNSCNYGTGRSNLGPYHGYQNNWWTGFQQHPTIMGTPMLPSPGYVEHQQAKKVRSDVNVHKNTIRLEVDEHNPDHFLVSFVFDSMFDGSFTIYYFAKEEANCKLVPVFPGAFVPVKIPFMRGPGQKFCQPSGTGIDLGFFELDDLSNPSPGEDVFPLVISAETFSLSSEEHYSDPPLQMFTNMQITQAVLEKDHEHLFKVKVIQQILWIDGVRYELRELYGIGTSSDLNDNNSGKECVICMMEPKDTAVLPCRHMCMCSECAKALRLQSNKCPICRQPIEELMVIKIQNVDQ